MVPRTEDSERSTNETETEAPMDVECLSLQNQLSESEPEPYSDSSESYRPPQLTLESDNENIENISSFVTNLGTGQNRNWNMFYFMIYIVNNIEHISEITVCYLVSGHSFLPNDSDFSDISKAQKKKQHVYTPQEWMDLVRNCRRRKPFMVMDMVGKFVDFTGLVKIMNNKGQSNNGNRILISKMRKIKFHKGDSRIYFNDDYSDDYDFTDLDKGGNRDVFINALKSFTPSEKSFVKPLTYQKFQD